MNYPTAMQPNAIERFYGEDPSPQMDKLEDITTRTTALCNEAWAITNATIRWRSLSWAMRQAVVELNRLVYLSVREIAKRDGELERMKDANDDGDKGWCMESVGEVFAVYRNALGEYEA